MRAADTNVVLRVITHDEPEQVSIAERFIERGAWISQLVLAEVAWVLRTGYRNSHAEIAAAIEMLLRHDKFVIQDSEVVTAALAHYRGRPNLGFADCLIIEVARKAGHLPLGTFDRTLGELDGAEQL